jgi:hypothetical protein
MNNKRQTMYFSCISPTETVVGTEVTTSFAQASDVKTHRKASHSTKDDKIERAVYAHIRAMRTLGRTKTNTSEIAHALSLGVDEVNRAVAKLRVKGVRKI